MGSLGKYLIDNDMTIEEYVEEYVGGIEHWENTPARHLTQDQLMWQVKDLRKKVRSMQQMLVECDIRFTRSRETEEG